MRHCLFILITLLTSTCIDAQVLNISSVSPWKKESTLSPKFVSSNRIEEVQITQMVKREGGGIEHVLDQVTLRFDANGYVATMEEVRKLFGKADSTRTEFLFDSQGKLRSREEHHQGQHLVYLFTYDTKDRPTGNTTESKTAQSGQNLHIQDEETRWRQINDTLFFGTTYNNLDLPYKEVRLTYNALGYLIASSETQLMTKTKRNEIFEYNDKGLLAKREVRNSSGLVIVSEHYFYDERGQLIVINVCSGDQPTEHYEVVYTRDLLVEGILVQNHQSRDIQIYKFSYTFRSN